MSKYLLLCDFLVAPVKCAATDSSLEPPKAKKTKIITKVRTLFDSKKYNSGKHCKLLWQCLGEEKIRTTVPFDIYVNCTVEWVKVPCNFTFLQEHVKIYFKTFMYEKR